MKALGKRSRPWRRWPRCCRTKPSEHDNGEIETVRVNELRVGDVVLVRPGGSVPADGDIIDGEAGVDSRW
jgi:cation transport ATPase